MCVRALPKCDKLMMNFQRILAYILAKISPNSGVCMSVCIWPKTVGETFLKIRSLRLKFIADCVSQL